MSSHLSPIVLDDSDSDDDMDSLFVNVPFLHVKSEPRIKSERIATKTEEKCIARVSTSPVSSSSSSPPLLELGQWIVPWLPMTSLSNTTNNAANTAKSSTAASIDIEAMEEPEEEVVLELADAATQEVGRP